MKIKNYLTNCKFLAAALLVSLTAQKISAQTITSLSVPGATSNGSGTTWSVDFITSSSTTAGYKAIDVSMNNTKGEYIVFDDTSASSDWEVVQSSIPTSGSWFGFCKTMLINDNACTGNCTVRFYIRNKGTSNGTFKNKITIAVGNSGSSCSYSTSGAYTLGVTMEKVSATGIYTWIGTHGSGDSTWGQADNWSPTRTTPSTSDILVVDLGSKGNTVTSTIDVSGVTQSISQFRIYNYNNVVFKCTTSNATITVGNGAAGDDFLIDSFGSMMGSGSALFTPKIASSNNFLSKGKIGMLSGYMNFGGAGEHVISGDIITTGGSLFFNPVSGTNTLYFRAASQSIISHTGVLYIDSNMNVEVGRASMTSTLVLQRSLAMYSVLKLLPNTTIISNVPNSSSTADYVGWTPFLQFRASGVPGAKSRGQLDVMPSTASILGGTLFEIYGTDVRAYRMIGMPFKNGFNLSQLTDDIDITGSYSGDNRDSFSTNCSYCINSSFFWDENSQAWVPFASDNTPTNITHGVGIFVFWRGGKSVGLGNPSSPANNSMIRVKGEVFVGSKTINLNYNGSGTTAGLRGYNLISNPYPCSIDFNKIVKPTGFKQKFVIYDGRAKTYNIWDSTVSGSLSRTGSTNFSSSSQNNSRIIAPGAAFFAIASSTGESLTFNESSKVTTLKTSHDNFKSSSNDLKCNEVRVGIRFTNDSIPENDNALIQLDMNYDGIKQDFDSYDAAKLHGGFLSIGTTTQSGEWLSLDRRNGYDIPTFSIPLRIKTPEKNMFKLTMQTCESNKMNKDVVLVDKMLSKVFPVRNGSEYYFVKNSMDSLNDNRFELMFTDLQQISSTKSIQKSNDYIVYPNPSVDGMYNLINNSGQKVSSVQVLSMDGKVIKNISTNGSEDLIRVKIESKGMYLLRIVGNNKVTTQIIQNN